MELGQSEFDAGNIQYSGHGQVWALKIWNFEAQTALAWHVAISGPQKVPTFRAPKSLHFQGQPLTMAQKMDVACFKITLSCPIYSKQQIH